MAVVQAYTADHETTHGRYAPGGFVADHNEPGDDIVVGGIGEYYAPPEGCDTTDGQWEILKAVSFGSSPAAAIVHGAGTEYRPSHDTGTDDDDYGGGSGGSWNDVFECEPEGEGSPPQGSEGAGRALPQRGTGPAVPPSGRKRTATKGHGKKAQRGLTKREAAAKLKESGGDAELEAAIADPYVDAYNAFDTNILAVKQSARGRDARLKWFEWHCRLGHVGPGEMFGHRCRICDLIKGKLHRIFTKVDPFVPLRPGWAFVTDILTVNVESKLGRCYVMCTRCVATGWYTEMVFLTTRNEAARSFAKMVRRLRANPRYQGHGYDLMQELRLDQAGEFTGDEWHQTIEIELGIKLTFSPKEDKRGAPLQEASIKHIAMMIKAILLQTLVPTLYWEECAMQARRIRNLVPLARDIVSKDGDTKRPEEVMSRGLVSRWACERLLKKTIPVGSVCIVYNSDIIGSNIMRTKGEWMVAMGCTDELNDFMNPFTGHIKTSNSFVVHTLPEHMGYPQFFGLPGPPCTLAGVAVMQNVVEQDIVINIEGIDAQLKGARYGDDVEVTRHTGTPVRGIYIRDTATGKIFTHDEHGELQVVRRGADGDDVTEITVTEGARVNDKVVTAREYKIARLASQPEFVVGEIFWKRFHLDDAAKTNLGDFKGIVVRWFDLPGTGRRWLALFDDGENTELSFDQVVHHVLDKYVTDVGLPDVDQVKSVDRVVAADVAATTDHGAEPEPGELEDAYIRVEHEMLDITVRRPILFLAEHVKLNRAGTYTLPEKMTFFRACDNMGIPQRLRRLYYRWLGKNYGPSYQTRRQLTAMGALGARFCNPWEGGSKPMIQKSMVLPLPEGASWLQWMGQHRRDGFAARYAGETVQMADRAECDAAAVAYAAHHWQRDHHGGNIPFYDLNMDNVGDAPSVRELELAHGRACRLPR